MLTKWIPKSVKRDSRLLFRAYWIRVYRPREAALAHSDLSDEEWWIIKPLLSLERDRKSRPFTLSFTHTRIEANLFRVMQAKRG